jgi:hypothetical protein
MTPEEAEAMLKRIDKPATEEEIIAFKEYLKTDVGAIQTALFHHWLPVNKALIMDMQKRGLMSNN